MPCKSPNPSRFGMFMSEMIKLGLYCLALAKPISPSLASTTWPTYGFNKEVK